MKKKFISVMMSIAMIVAMIPMTAMGEEKIIKQEVGDTQDIGNTKMTNELLNIKEDNKIDNEIVEDGEKEDIENQELPEDNNTDIDEENSENTDMPEDNGGKIPEEEGLDTETLEVAMLLEAKAGDTAIDISSGAVTIDANGASQNGQLIQGSNAAARYIISGNGGNNTITISKDTTVVLSNLSIDTADSSKSPITVNADVTILIDGTNSLKSGDKGYSGINVKNGKTLNLDSSNPGTMDGELSVEYTGTQATSGPSGNTDTGNYYGAAIGSILKEEGAIINVKGGSYDISGYNTVFGERQYDKTTYNGIINILGGKFTGSGKDVYGGGTFASGKTVTIAKGMTIDYKSDELMKSSESAITLENITAYGGISCGNGDITIENSNLSSYNLDKRRKISAEGNVIVTNSTVITESLYSKKNITVKDSELNTTDQIYAYYDINMNNVKLNIIGESIAVVFSWYGSINIEDSKFNAKINGMSLDRRAIHAQNGNSITLKNSTIDLELNNDKDKPDRPDRSYGVYGGYANIVLENVKMNGLLQSDVGSLYLIYGENTTIIDSEINSNGFVSANSKLDIQNSKIVSTNPNNGIYSFGDIRIAGGYINLARGIRAAGTTVGTKGLLTIGEVDNEVGPIIYASSYGGKKDVPMEINSSLLFEKNEEAWDGYVYGAMIIEKLPESLNNTITIDTKDTLLMDKENGTKLSLGDKIKMNVKGNVTVGDGTEIELLSGSSMTNAGAIDNNSAIKVNAGAVLENTGTLINHYGGSVSGEGTISNTGTVKNALWFNQVNKNGSVWDDFDGKNIALKLPDGSYAKLETEVEVEGEAPIQPKKIPMYYAGQGENTIMIDPALSGSNNTLAMRETGKKIITAWSYLDYSLSTNTIKFDSNYESSPIASEVVVFEGELYGKAWPTVQRNGYELIGWNTQANGSGVMIAATDLIVAPLPTILYAQWKKKEIVIGGETDKSKAKNKKPELNIKDHGAYMSGYPDGTFGQDKMITRAEAAVIFSNLIIDNQQNNAQQLDFSDTNQNEWYAEKVGKIVELGIMAGYPDGTFRPDDQITRAEFATIAANFDKLDKIEEVKFVDLNTSHWAYEYIARATKRQWVGGYPDGTFRPENGITRAEVVVVTNNMLERTADKSYSGKGLRIYKDLNTSHWAYYPIMEATNSHDYTKDDSKVETWIGFK